MLQQEEAAYYSFGLSMLSDLYSSQGKFKASREKVKEGVERAQEAEEKRWLLGWHMASAYIEYVSGNFEQALKALDRYWNFAVELRKLVDQAYCLCFRGLVYLEMASVDSAQETADELQQFMEQNKTVDTSYYDFLLGSIELEHGNYSRAISFFEKALVNSETFFLFSFSAALAYYGAGDLEKAQKECEKILSPSLRAYGIGYPWFLDLYAKSYYMLGKIYEKKGWPGKAIEHYEKFLTLWKDADPGIAEVDDARERVAWLKIG